MLESYWLLFNVKISLKKYNNPFLKKSYGKTACRQLVSLRRSSIFNRLFGILGGTLAYVKYNSPTYVTQQKSPRYQHCKSVQPPHKPAVPPTKGWWPSSPFPAAKGHLTPQDSPSLKALSNFFTVISLSSLQQSATFLKHYV